MQKLSIREIVLIGIGIFLSLGILVAIFFKFGDFGAILASLLFATLFFGYYILKNPELGWYGIIFFLPFERFPSINLGGVDIRINTILGFITLLVWILSLIGNSKKYKIQPNAVALPLILFFSACLLSLLQAVNFDRALTVLLFVIFTMLLGVLATNMIDSKERLQKTILILFLSSFIVGIFGLFQFGGDVVGIPSSITLLKKGYGSEIFGFPRVQAFSMEPLYLANYLMIPIFAGLALFFNKVNIFKNEYLSRWGLVILLILLMTTFVLTVSRGAYVGFAVAFLVLAILLFKKVLTWKNILIFILTVVVVGYGVAFALSKGEGRATNEFIGHIFLKDYSKGESVQGRLDTYKLALDAYKQNNLFGIGIGNFGPWMLGFPEAPRQGGWAIVNNEFLEILGEEGAIGLITFSLIIIVIVWRTFLALKYSRDIFLRSVLIGLFAALIGILVQYNFMSTLYIIHFWVLIGLLVGVQNLILLKKAAA